MTRQARLFFVLGAVFALLAVAAGAFATHALKTLLTADLLVVFETGARYQMYHALGLFVAAWAASARPARAATLAGWLFVSGIVLFSGSLYALALSGVREFGAVTPFGGFSFLAGWACLMVWALVGARQAQD